MTFNIHCCTQNKYMVEDVTFGRGHDLVVGVHDLLVDQFGLHIQNEAVCCITRNHPDMVIISWEVAIYYIIKRGKVGGGDVTRVL